MATEKALFGEFFHQKRRALGVTLREFCRTYSLDVGNISKLERGKLTPPRRRDILEEYAGHLRIEEGSDDWYAFFDLARVEAGRIPEDIQSDEKLARALPLLFRSLRNHELTEETLDKIIDIARET